MNITIACCDDEKQYILNYKELFSKFKDGYEIPFHVDYFMSGEQLVERFQNGKMYDIVFLDMEMPHINGMDVANEIRTICGNDTRILFLTSYAEYMQQSFDVRAFHYMVKPVRYEEFERKFKSALEDIIKEEKDILVFKSEKEDIVVHSKDLIYIEKEKNKKQLRIHLKDEIICVKGNMNDVEQHLREKHFYRIHRAILVNIRYIKRIRKDEILLTNGEIIPLSRRKEAALKDYFMKYAILERKS